MRAYERGDIQKPLSEDVCQPLLRTGGKLRVLILRVSCGDRGSDVMRARAHWGLHGQVFGIIHHLTREQKGELNDANQ